MTLPLLRELEQKFASRGLLLDVKGQRGASNVAYDCAEAVATVRHMLEMRLEKLVEKWRNPGSLAPQWLDCADELAACFDPKEQA